MIKNNIITSKDSKDLFDIYEAFYKCDKFINDKNNKVDFMGYLINKESLDDLKNKILDDKFLPYIKEKYSYQKLKKLLKKVILI